MCSGQVPQSAFLHCTSYPLTGASECTHFKSKYSWYDCTSIFYKIWVSWGVVVIWKAALFRHLVRWKMWRWLLVGNFQSLVLHLSQWLGFRAWWLARRPTDLPVCNKNLVSHQGRILIPDHCVLEMTGSSQFSVNDIRVFVPIVNAHPHLHMSVRARNTQFMENYLSECAQTSKNTASNPSRVLSLWRCKDLNSHVLDS